ncbi:MAG: hypothetical protein WCL02_04175 [bacterium]
MFVLLFILLSTGAIQLYKMVAVQGDIIEVVRDTKEVSLNDFLKQYNA